MKLLIAIWKFSRPHTVIGSAISIVSLYFILCANRERYFPLLICALVAGVANNIFIVGLNQIADVRIDRINKPWLPIPARLLSMRQAKIIVYTCLFISLVISLLMSPYFFSVIVLASLIGWAYSMPPFHLKQHHLPAAMAISFVRGLLVNVGGFLVFRSLTDHSGAMPENVKMLTFFICLFAVVIAWFKDLPDTQGDSKYNIRTMAVMYSPRTVIVIGTIIMACVYLCTIYFNAYPAFSGAVSRGSQIIFYGHIILFILFVINSCAVSLSDPDSVRSFYKRFWIFFFAEYLLYMVAYF
jgi:homogentisate phytyltransferase / homogentisate geranylgeranyltransferase